MSLILEALRKLEREKPATERGVVVMTTAGLVGDRPRVASWTWLVVGLVAGVAAAFVGFELRAPKAPPVPARAPVSVPAKAPLAAPALPTTVAAVPGSTVTAHVSPPAAALPATTRPAAAATPTPLVLQAITTQDGKPVALINDRVLREGDEVEGVRIVRIGDTEVEIERGGVRSVLRF